MDLTVVEDRVGAHTALEVNERIDSAAQRRVIPEEGQPGAVLAQQLKELDREWDIERWLEMRGDGMKYIRWICFGICILALCSSKICAQAVSGLSAVRVAFGLTQPVFVTAPPGDTRRLFIVRQTGQVHILNLATGKLNATAFLDIHTRLRTSGEQGLLGMAFDPNYTTNGKFYLNFTVPGGTWGNGVTHVSQFQVSAGNPDVANTSNEKILLTFSHPEANHNGGWIGFSPRTGDDHNLYIATGDGGSENDQGIGHIEPGGNAQNNTTLLGKMLRIHVNPTTGMASIPSNNPFFGSNTLRQEIWAFGLRNPWRNSFDRQSGRMFIGDVGGDAREEIDLQRPVNPGGGENYEWRLREGKIATSTGGVGGPRPPGGVDPIFDYPHSTGQCVIGGYVYRGNQIPALRGTYVFADYLGPELGSQGKIFTLNYNGGTTASNFQNVTAKLFPTKVGGYLLKNPSSLGEDANGELYITDIGNGNVYKIVPPTTSAHIDTVRALPEGHAMVEGSGVPFEAYTIEATAGLAPAFSPIGTITAEGDGRFEFEDIYAGNFPERQYRVTPRTP